MSEQLNLDEIRARCERATNSEEPFCEGCRAVDDVRALLALVDRLTAHAGELEAGNTALQTDAEIGRLTRRLADEGDEVCIYKGDDFPYGVMVEYPSGGCFDMVDLTAKTLLDALRSYPLKTSANGVVPAPPEVAP